MHLVGLLSSYFAHDARSQEPKEVDKVARSSPDMPKISSSFEGELIMSRPPLSGVACHLGAHLQVCLLVESHCCPCAVPIWSWREELIGDEQETTFATEFDECDVKT